MNRRLRRWGVVLGAALLTACVSAPHRRPPAALVQGDRYLTQGVAAYAADDYVNAASLFNQALTYYRGLDDRRGIVESRIDLAETALAVGRYAAAEGQLQAAGVIAGEEGMAAAQQRIGLLLSSLAIRQGRFDAALRQLAPLLSSGDVAAGVRRSALANRAEIALRRPGDDPAAWVGRFADAARGSGDRSLLALLARFRAALKVRAGDDAAAVALLRRALGIYKSIPSRAGTATALEQWGGLLAARKQWPAAEEKLQRALQVRLWLLDRAGTVADLRRLAAADDALGRAGRAAALRHWAQAVAGHGPVDWPALRQEAVP